MILSRLGESIEEARRSKVSVGFCLLDLDRFKEVNDTLGHHVGDRLLSVAAQRIQGALRPNDVVARLGGDEYAILLDPVRNSAAAAEVAQRVRQALTKPFHLEGMLFELEASVGVAVFPEHGEDVEPIVRRADVAMYLAKEERTGVEVYARTETRTPPADCPCSAVFEVAWRTVSCKSTTSPRLLWAGEQSLGSRRSFGGITRCVGWSCLMSSSRWRSTQDSWGR